MAQNNAVTIDDKVKLQRYGQAYAFHNMQAALISAAEFLALTLDHREHESALLAFHEGVRNYAGSQVKVDECMWQVLDRERFIRIDNDLDTSMVHHPMAHYAWKAQQETMPYPPEHYIGAKTREQGVRRV